MKKKICVFYLPYYWKNCHEEYIVENRIILNGEQVENMEYFRNLLNQKHAFVICFGVICVIYAILFSLLRTESIWISDEGNRLMSVQAYAATGGKFLPDPFEGITDLPSGVRAYPKPYFVQENGQWRSAYALLFPYLASFVYLLGSWEMLFWIAPFFGLLAVLFTGLLGRLLLKEECKAVLCMILCAFGTPLLFYSGTFLETTCAGAFALAGLYVFMLSVEKESCSPKQDFLWSLASGMLLGISCLFREESFIFAFGMGTGLMLFYFRWSRLSGMALGGVLWCAGLFLYNYMDSGSIFGMHSCVYDSLGRPEGNKILLCLKDYSFYLFLLCLPAFPVWNVFFPWFFPLALGGAFFRKIRNGLLFVILLLTWICCALSNYWNLTTTHGGVFIYQALLDHLPFWGSILVCSGVLLRSGKERSVRFLVYLSIICVFLPVLGLNFAQPGMFWGGRHFLNIVPVLCILAFVILAEKDLFGKSVRYMTAALMILSVAVNLTGYGVLKMKKEYSAAYVKALAHPDVKVIVTDVFFFPEEIAFLNRQKTVILLTEKNSLEQILPLLKRNGVRSFHLVLGKNSRRLSNESIRRAAGSLQIREGEFFPSERFGFFQIQIFHCTLR